jgi:ABC-2 type transport system ATP-binding protein
MIRRLEIGQAMLHKPKVLFLDEPTIGLDPAGRKLVWEHIRKLNQEEHMTIFLTTHYMEEAEALCDQIGIIDHGRLSVVGSPQQLKEKVGVGTVTFVLDSKNNDASANPTAVFSGIEGVDISQLASNTWQLRISHPDEQMLEILRKLIQHHLLVSDLEIRGPSLEDVFLKFTGSRFDEESAHNDWKAIKGRRRTVRRVK